MSDRSIHLGKFPAMPCARSSHARTDMHAAGARRCGAAAALPGSIRVPSCPNSGRATGAAAAGWWQLKIQMHVLVGCQWMAATSWCRELPPPPPPLSLLSLYLSLSLGPLLQAVSPRRISLVCTIRQDRRGNGGLILHDERDLPKLIFFLLKLPKYI